MSDKFCVVWGRTETPALRLMPTDEKSFADTEEGAKEIGRKMLVPLKTSGLMPVGILRVEEDQIEKMIISDREVHEIPKAEGTFDKEDPKAEDVLEFLQLQP